MDLQFAGYELKLRERQLIGPGGSVDLSSRSFDILVALLARPNEMIEKSDLFDAAWPGVVVEENTLQVHVSSLRKILGPATSLQCMAGATSMWGHCRNRWLPTQPPLTSGPRKRVMCLTTGRSVLPAKMSSRALPRCSPSTGSPASLAPGGVGKTTLAVEMAARQQEEVQRRCLDCRPCPGG